MGNYVLNQFEIKMPKNENTKALAEAIAEFVSIQESHIPKSLTRNDDALYNIADNHFVLEAEKAFEELFFNRRLDSADAPAKTPYLALTNQILETDDAYIIYLAFTSKGGYPDTQTNNYPDDFFDDAYQVALILKKVTENFNSTIAYDAKSEYETYQKRPFRRLV